MAFNELPFDTSMMVHFRKRLSGNILKEINALIIERRKEEEKKADDGEPTQGIKEIKIKRR